ncbi:antihemorrhagic factor cHLP-B-like [Erythrolamprus reginae]|uniref:antihemorrhagic factor cHLP-B-like n=1 Tax=Erythrolamprus reginae TaxID=121349 RepID=UPI00396C51A8
MNSLVALVLLGQFIGGTLSYFLYPQLDCNGEKAKELADLAVHYINDHNLHGYKVALNVIADVHSQSKGRVEEATFIDLYLLETDCHVLDPTPVENCTVRPQHEHAVEGHCTLRINSDGTSTRFAAKCHSKPDSEEDVRRHCPKCQILLPLNDHHVVECVDYVIHKHNEKLPNHAYQVLEISRGQHKFEPEAFYVEFAIVETNCTHQEIHDDHHHCHPKPVGEAHIGFCKATVFRSHDATEKPKDEQYESDCVIFDVKEGHSRTHLIDHHFGKHVASPAHNNTVLDLAHSHNDKNTLHSVPILEETEDGRETVVDHGHEIDTKICPGNIYHFKV